MTDSRSHPFPFNPLLGVLGLFAAAGATGIYAVTNTEPTETTETAIVETGEMAYAQVGELAASAPEELRQVTPMTIAESGPDGVMPADTTSAEIVYIVRIKGAPEIDTIARNFKRNRETADAAFADLVATRPGLSEFALVGASYSGEIKLMYVLPPGTPPTRDVVMEIKANIMAIEGVAYADPDYVAHPEKEN